MPEKGSSYLEVLQKAFEDCATELGRLQECAWKQVMKVSPGNAKDVELLRCPPGPLEVVHNSNLPEVRKHVDLWKSAIVQEV